jgi:RNA polymerase sigma factor (sigma-70 family)
MIVDLIPALRAFSRTLCRPGLDADDLVQETLVRALANLDQYTPGTKLKSWLFTIMHNIFYTSIKRYKRESPDAADDVASGMGRLCATPPSQEWHAVSQDVHLAIVSLPPSQREALVLVAILGTSYDDAARICKCEIGTIKSRLNRARFALAQSLGEKDGRVYLAAIA